MDATRPPLAPPTPHPTANEARQAVPLHAMRHVLWVSLLLAVLGFLVAYAVFRT
jgi:hypothetical protein